GQPLPGVNVTINDRALSSSTDSEGQFSISSSNNEETLKFTFIGFMTKEVTLSKGESHVVVMEPEVSSLEQVVVVGYGQVKKRDLTGAVSSITGDDLSGIPVQRADQMLQGRAAGVQVTSTTGAPGAGTTIRIRGNRSVSASNEPLYVINGIVGAGDLNTINPADIESIDVLKDASAAAIYGSRASNGVIIITTKQGKAGRDRISFSTNHGISNVPKLVDMMEAKDFVSFVNEAYIDQGQQPLYPNVDSV